MGFELNSLPASASLGARITDVCRYNLIKMVISFGMLEIFLFFNTQSLTLSKYVFFVFFNNLSPVIVLITSKHCLVIKFPCFIFFSRSQPKYQAEDHLRCHISNTFFHQSADSLWSFPLVSASDDYPSLWQSQCEFKVFHIFCGCTVQMSLLAVEIVYHLI